MNTNILEKPQTISKQSQIISRLANNEPMKHIAKDNDISIGTVHNIKKANVEKIETIKNQLIQKHLDNIILSIETDININKDISNNYKNDLNNITTEKTQFKNTIQRNIINPLLQKIGIFPTAYGNVATVNIQNIQNNTLGVPEYQEYLSMKAETRQVIDINADTAITNNDNNVDSSNEIQ